MDEDPGRGRFRRSLLSFLITFMLSAMSCLVSWSPHDCMRSSLVDANSTLKNPVDTGVDLSSSGLLRYVFHSTVDVGQFSQPFFFTVPANASGSAAGPYLSAELMFEPLASERCDLDLSIWDAQEERTGGRTPYHSASSTDIPYSNYTQLSGGIEIIEVDSVGQGTQGLWKASAYCDLSFHIGAMFTIAISILLDDPLAPNSSGPAFEFNVPSNVQRIDARLEHINSFNFDFSLWDGFGRRTGGPYDSDSEIRFWIPNSEYTPSLFSPESITIAPVLSIDNSKQAGELWRATVSCVDGFGSGNYALTLDIRYDTDADGVEDSEDINPLKDLCVRLLVTSLRQLDPIDEDENPWDPYMRFGAGESVPGKEAQGGQGDAWESHVLSRSKVPIAPDEDFVGGYSMWKNVPDNARAVSLLIQVWDKDGRGDDDICDISPLEGGGSESSQDSSTLHIYYDLLTQTWSGDVSGGYSSGESDDSVGSSGDNDEDDAEIFFTLSTVEEVNVAHKLFLAERFAPTVYLDPFEDSGPLEIWSALNQSELRKPHTKQPLVGFPVKEHDLSVLRTGSFLRVKGFDSFSYIEQTYANVFTSDNDTIVIQYWFFYLRDSVSPHQGDWEMIQLVFGERSRHVLLSELIPKTLAYSQHYGGEVREWTDPEVLKDNTHVGVFVELGGHSSMFTGSEEPGAIYPLSIMSPSPWLNYSGKWGSSRWDLGPGGNSPPGPVYRASMHCDWLGKPTSPIAYIWHEPLYWMEGYQ